jgi:hypothetical protein
MTQRTKSVMGAKARLNEKQIGKNKEKWVLTNTQHSVAYTIARGKNARLPTPPMYAIATVRIHLG